MIINTNLASLSVLENLRKNNKQMTSVMAQLSSGKRINSAGDDAAGLAISERMTSQLSSFNISSRNAGDGISLLQTSEAALGSISNVLQRMRELATQSGNGTYGTQDRKNLNAEFQELLKEVDNIAYGTKFNGVLLTSVGGNPYRDITRSNGPAVTASDATGTDKIAGGTATQQEVRIYDIDGNDLTETIGGTGVTYNQDPETGQKWINDSSKLDGLLTGDYVVHVRTKAGTVADSAATPDIDESKASNATILEFNKLNANTGKKLDRSLTIEIANRGQVDLPLQRAGVSDLGLTGISVDSLTNSQTATQAIDKAFNSISTSRATLGALQSRLNYSVDNLNSAAETTAASRSQFLDADMAKSMSEMTKYRILAQSSIAVLQQANANPQMMLQLFQG